MEIITKYKWVIDDLERRSHMIDYDDAVDCYERKHAFSRTMFGFKKKNPCECTVIAQEPGEN